MQKMNENETSKICILSGNSCTQLSSEAKHRTEANTFFFKAIKINVSLKIKKHPRFKKPLKKIYGAMTLL